MAGRVGSCDSHGRERGSKVRAVQLPEFEN